jgi:hypothetical protein
VVKYVVFFVLQGQNRKSNDVSAKCLHQLQTNSKDQEVASAVLKASREGMKKLSVLRVEQRENGGDRPGSVTTSIYFDMRIWVIRD